jgi:hypothetical protein
MVIPWNRRLTFANQEIEIHPDLPAKRGREKVGTSRVLRS